MKSIKLFRLGNSDFYGVGTVDDANKMYLRYYCFNNGENFEISNYKDYPTQIDSIISIATKYCNKMGFVMWSN